MFDEAEHALKRGLELAPATKRFYLLADLGRVYQRRGDRAAAERFYRDAIAADPDDTHGYIYLGALMASGGRLDEAEATHRRATRCPRGSVDEAYLNLGHILRARARYEEAIACFREAVRLDPHYKLAKDAMKDCKQALQIVSNEPI
jgi:tetratricopeptide (TPR) repeat protein